MVLVFPHERPIFLREVKSNMYSVSAYFFGRLIAEFPGAIIVPVVYGSMIYFLVGLDTAHFYKFPVFCKLL